MFRFMKKIFVVAMSCSSCCSCNALECVSVNNQKCKVRPEIINIESSELHFILTMLIQIDAVVVVTISITHMQSYVFLMLLKT